MRNPSCSTKKAVGSRRQTFSISSAGEHRMARHHMSASSAHQPPAHAGRHDLPVIFDAFVSDIYLPHAKLRKRSWSVDERIARQHLSPAFGDRRLADIQRHEVEEWCTGCRKKVWPRPPATAFWRSSRPSALWRNGAGFSPSDNHHAPAFPPSKSTRNGNAISRGMKRGGSCGRWKKATAQRLSPSACFC